MAFIKKIKRKWQGREKWSVTAVTQGSPVSTKEIADRLIPLMEKCGCDICKQLLELKHSLVKKSQWIFGGDGWGYDIRFGGLDHVLASGEDVNVVVDAEVYFNTGGQSSKTTPASAKLPPQGR